MATNMIRNAVCGFSFCATFLVGSLAAFAAKPIEIVTKDTKSCDNIDSRIETQGRVISSLSELQGRTMVAGRVLQVIDDSDSKARIYLETRLLPTSQEVRIMCSSGLFSQGKRAQVTLPLIIDLTSKRSLGDTFWSFQLYKSTQGFFAMNTKTMSMSISPTDVVNFLKSEYPDFQIRETAEGKIRIHLVVFRKQFRQSVVVEYDLL